MRHKKGGKMNAIETYAQAMIAHEYDYLRERDPKRFANIPPETLAEFEQRTRDDATELAEHIRTRSPEFVRRVMQGMLYPNNKHSRQLYESITGETLPRSVKDTEALVWNWPEVKAYREQRAAERDAKEKQRAAEEQQRQAKYIAELSEAVRNDEPISGESLVDLAKHLGLSIHPRTVGTLRNRVGSLNSSSGRAFSTRSGTFNLPTTVFQLYRDCRAQLSETHEATK